MKKLVLFLIFFSQFAYSQNTLDVNFDLGFGTYYQFSTFGNTQFNQVIIPDILPRRADNFTVQNNWNLDNDFVTDNPFFHGSYFFNFSTDFKYNDELFVNAIMNVEQRGFSDGRFSRNTLNFFPTFNARYQKRIGKFSYLFQAGDFRNLKLYEGLTFYNIETQSWIFKFKYDKFYIKHSGIGDLLRGIGLGIDDVYDYSMGIEQLKLEENGSLYMDARIGYSNNRGNFGGFRNLSIKLAQEDKWNIYTQISGRTTGGNAFLFGVNLDKLTKKRWTIDANFEYRNYSAEFNDNYVNTVFYRDPDRFSSFINSTNDVFFPLDVYERNFSQWAIFTEYQSRNVSGLQLRSEVLFQLLSKTYLKAKIDFNYLMTADENTFYPFYHLGIGVKPTEEIDIFLEMTNKVLNLDKNYPTLYATRGQYFLIHIYKSVKANGKNNEMHRYW